MQYSVHQNGPSKQSQRLGLIKGYASLFDTLDHHNDRIVKGAFERTLRAWRLMGRMPKMLWQHDPKQPLGVWTHLYEDKQGLFAEGRLACGVAKADEAYLLLKQGAIEGLSIGFRLLKSTREKHRRTRLILDLDLVEISLVTFGANPKATVTGIKCHSS